MTFLSLLPMMLLVAALVPPPAAQEAGGATKHSTESVCLLSSATNGQTITVRGKVRSGAHDMTFEIPGCNETVLLTFAGDQDNKVSATELRQNREMRRFQKYTSSVYKSKGPNICMDCLKYGDVEAEVTGELEIATMPLGATKDKARFIRDPSGKIIGMFGWGHPGPFADYRLIIESVSHVTAQKLPPPK